MKLFFVSLGTTLVAIIAPIAIWVAFDRSNALGSVIALVFTAGLALGVRRVILLSRTPGAKMFERSSNALLTLCLTGGVLLSIFGSTVSTIDQHAQVHLITTTRVADGTITSTGETVTYAPSFWGWVALGIFVLALVVVFLALTFIPSTERELRRRIDLEASSVALGTSILFFFMYDGFSFVLHLPKFTSAVAILSMIVAYLIARIVLAVRYK